MRSPRVASLLQPELMGEAPGVAGLCQSFSYIFGTPFGHLSSLSTRIPSDLSVLALGCAIKTCHGFLAMQIFFPLIAFTWSCLHSTSATLSVISSRRKFPSLLKLKDRFLSAICPLHQARSIIRACAVVL